MSDHPKKAPDWDAIERDYRAGMLSLREIATKDGCVTEGAIRKRAKRDEWVRDLTQKIAAKADDLVRRGEVRSSVRTENAISDREIIEANALRIAQVRGEHRSDINRARRLSMALLEELEAQTADVPALIQLGEMLRNEDDKGIDKLNDIYRCIISLPERTKTMKLLSDSLKTLVGLEREAYGLAEAPKVDMTVNDGKSQLPPDPIEAARAYQKLMAGG